MQVPNTTMTMGSTALDQMSVDKKASGTDLESGTVVIRSIPPSEDSLAISRDT